MIGINNKGACILCLASISEVFLDQCISDTSGQGSCVLVLLLVQGTYTVFYHVWPRKALDELVDDQSGRHPG